MCSNCILVWPKRIEYSFGLGLPLTQERILLENIQLSIISIRLVVMQKRGFAKNHSHIYIANHNAEM